MMAFLSLLWSSTFVRADGVPPSAEGGEVVPVGGRCRCGDAAADCRDDQTRAGLEQQAPHISQLSAEPTVRDLPSPFRRKRAGALRGNCGSGGRRGGHCGRPPVLRA
jgi:hypothetical protein